MPNPAHGNSVGEQTRSKRHLFPVPFSPPTRVYVAFMLHGAAGGGSGSVLDRLLTFLQTNWATRDRTGWHDDAPMRAF
jgi:hypothetical protein